jgi:crotonobetaine/carnitine-CoA ligase
MTDADGRELPLPRLVDLRAGTVPHREFLRVIGGGPPLTYGAAAAGMVRWAAALAHGGVAADDHVAVLLPNGADAVLLQLGLGRLGAVEVPVNTAFRGRMLVHVLDDSSARVLVTDASFLPRLREVAGRLRKLEKIVVLGGDGAGEAIGDLSVVPGEAFLDPAAVESTADRGVPGPDVWDLAAVMYTSGTTGRSKGVRVPWGQLLATATAHPPGMFTADDVWYSPLPLFHVSGKTAVYMAALAGGRVVIRDTFSTTEFFSDIRAHGCTVTFLVSSMYQFLMSRPAAPDDARSPLRLVGLVPVPPTIGEFTTRFGVDVFTSYNSTELSCPITSWGPLPREGASGTAGRVRPGYACRIVDEHDRPVPTGTMGELVVRADEPWVLMDGYHGLPEATVEVWRNGWFHTGDAFVADEHGTYRFVDRRRDAIRRRGENISSVEVEAEVDAHPDVAESAAVPVPSEHGDDEVKVFVVRRADSRLAAAELVAWLTGRMAGFMVPRFVEFVDELPRTETMKVRKADLVARGHSLATWDRAASS